MTLSPEQFSKFVENYAYHIINGLDVESLQQMVFDLLVLEYQTHTEDEIVAEIKDLYGDNVAAELLEEV
jgi:hypothetical protein